MKIFIDILNGFNGFSEFFWSLFHKIGQVENRECYYIFWSNIWNTYYKFQKLLGLKYWENNFLNNEKLN